jgi:hypothetical protein
MIYEHGEPWWKYIGRKNFDSSTRGLWLSYQQSFLVAKEEELGEENYEFGLKKYLYSYFERIFNML